jgi:hypothetical protein
MPVFEPSRQCPSCKQTWRGDFCHQCGEKKLSSNDLKFFAIIKQIFSSITEMDNKFFTSFRLFISRPGQLSNDYISGIRKNRLSPFQLFIFANIFYFFMTGFINQSTFATPLNFHINSTNFFHQELAKEMVYEKISGSQENFESYEERFNRLVKTHSKTLVFLQIPMFAFALMLCYINKRGNGIRHVVFSTYFIAFILLIGLIAHPIINQLLGFVLNLKLFNIQEYEYEIVFSICMFSIYTIYLYFALHRVYKESKIITLIKSILLTFFIYYMYLIYRMLLFFTTYYAS